MPLYWSDPNCFSKNASSFYNPDEPKHLVTNRDRFARCRGEYYGQSIAIAAVVIGLIVFGIRLFVVFRLGVEKTGMFWLREFLYFASIFATAALFYWLARMYGQYSARMDYDRVKERWENSKSTYNGNYNKFVQQLTKEQQVNAQERMGTALFMNAV